MLWTWIGQPRHLEGTRTITVPVQFLSDDPVTVTGIALRTPHFDPLPPEPKEALLHPSRKVALQVDVGSPRCGPVPDEPPQVHLTVRHGDDATRELVLPVPTWLLDALRVRECTVAALTEAVSVRFGDFDPPDGVTVGTELVVERGDSEPAADARRDPAAREQGASALFLGSPERCAHRPRLPDCRTAPVPGRPQRLQVAVSRSLTAAQNQNALSAGRQVRPNRRAARSAPSSTRTITTYRTLPSSEDLRDGTVTRNRPELIT